jgi:hypothetical protein
MGLLFELYPVNRLYGTSWAKLIAAKILDPLTFRALTLKPVNPELTAVQLDPLLVEWKTPPSKDPEKILLPFTAKALIVVEVKPEFFAVQLVPLFVDKKIPPP